MHKSTCDHSILIWQFYNNSCSYPLSIVNFLEEKLQTFALARVTSGTTTFSKELFFRSTYSFNFLAQYCSFWVQPLLVGTIWSITFLRRQYFFFLSYYLTRGVATGHSYFNCTGTTQKMKFSIRDFPNSQFPADLVTFTEEILNGNLYFLCNVASFAGSARAIHSFM